MPKILPFLTSFVYISMVVSEKGLSASSLIIYTHRPFSLSPLDLASLGTCSADEIDEIVISN